MEPATTIRVPEELQPILRDFTKAVLRDRPDDVLEYSKAYFVSKWEEQRMGERPWRTPRPPSRTHTSSTAAPAHLRSSDRARRSTAARPFSRVRSKLYSAA